IRRLERRPARDGGSAVAALRLAARRRDDPLFRGVPRPRRRGRRRARLLLPYAPLLELVAGGALQLSRTDAGDARRAGWRVVGVIVRLAADDGGGRDCLGNSGDGADLRATRAVRARNNAALGSQQRLVEAPLRKGSYVTC